MKIKTKKSGKPTTVDAHTWIYFKGRSMDIIHQVYDKDGCYEGTVDIHIPFNKIEKHLEVAQ